MASVRDLKYLEEIQKVLEPLKLDPGSSDVDIPEKPQECFLCSEEFEMSKQGQFLHHLFETHRLVIADVHNIADLGSYVKYWKTRFVDNPREEFCTTMLLDQKPDGTVSPGEKYYLLSDVIPQDKVLRVQLQQKRLEKVLEQHRIERCDDKFTRECWFCHLNYEGLRSGFIQHLSTAHNLQLGTPEKLVYVSELLDKIEEKLNSLHCIYCEKLFKDRMVLKEHMRKKMHKRVNPDDKSYDKYYLINYREFGKTWQSFTKPKSTKPVHRKPESDDEETENNSDENWAEWNDEYVENVHCLFCNVAEAEFEQILEHMQNVHEFSFKQISESIVFYQRIKLVNYIRRQIYLRNCIYCDINFDTAENLLKHMTASKHFKIPEEEKIWNQVIYMFPTYEDDTFLCYLDEVKDEIEIIENVVV